MLSTLMTASLTAVEIGALRPENGSGGCHAGDPPVASAHSTANSATDMMNVERRRLWYGIQESGPMQTGTNAVNNPAAVTMLHVWATGDPEKAGPCLHMPQLNTMLETSAEACGIQTCQVRQLLRPMYVVSKHKWNTATEVK